MPHFSYPFITWWTLRLFPHFTCCEQCCYECGCTNECLSPCFQLLCICRIDIVRLIGNSILYFLRNYQTVFQSGSPILHFYQQCTGVLISLQPCQHLFCFFDSVHLNACLEVTFLEIKNVIYHWSRWLSLYIYTLILFILINKICWC